MTMIHETQSVGDLLRAWRQRRRLSQLDLACEAEISTRHLSFLETGRARPSRDMVLRLAERLDIPLRDRNALLTAAGFAAVYRERPLDDPALKAARRAVDLVLSGHGSFPALAVDRHWQLVAANDATMRLMAGVDPSLLVPPVNVLRVSLHPLGLAPRIVNLAEWRAHLLARLDEQVATTADPTLAALNTELKRYPSGVSQRPSEDYGGVLIPLRLRTDTGILSFVSTTTVFGTPLDITLSELAVEAFYPADAETAALLQRLANVTEPEG